MSSEKLFTKQEKEAIEIVLGMGLIIENPANGYQLSSDWFEYQILNRVGETRDYKTISSAMTQFLKSNS